MFNISEYLKRFANLESNSRIQTETVQVAFKSIVGVENADFEVKKGIVYLKGSPMVKSATYTKKQLLLNEIKKKLPSVYDIR
jgi:hypothetical protein